MTKDYDIGRGRPPKRTQFKKGRSGNPKGRQKGSRNRVAEFNEELNEQITLTVNGRPVRVSKYRAVIKQLVAKATKGDLKATAMVLGETAKIVGPPAPANENDEPEDDAIIESYLKRKSPKGGRDD